jgi:sigma-54 specific flagellar transcriptional regulator A
MNAAIAATMTEPGRFAGVRFPTGNSRVMRQVNQQIRQVAQHDSTVLILGESGTGKEVAARAIHDASPRASRPFVPVNCGAIPAELLESELFGHEKGAFTGAISTRKGRFEMADSGTLFLDEIGDMSPTMQVKLLRVLQERVFERVGSNHTQRCDVRIIAATHRNLEEAITRGNFREDLFYRLNVFPIEMPGLRERLEDLDLLIADIADRHAHNGNPRVRLSTEALSALRRHRWPGNVRELGNLLERLAIQSGERLVEVGDLPARYRPADWVPSVDPLEFDESHGSVHDQLLRDAHAEMVTVADSGAISSDWTDSSNGDTAHLPTRSNDSATDIGGTTPTFEAGLVAASLSELPAEGLDLRGHLDTIERTLIEQALARSQGVVAHAARLLGLRRTTLVEKLRKHNLSALDLGVSES